MTAEPIPLWQRPEILQPTAKGIWRTALTRDSRLCGHGDHPTTANINNSAVLQFNCEKLHIHEHPCPSHSHCQENSGPAAASTSDVSAKSRRALGSESATLIDSTHHYDERGSQEMDEETPARVGRCRNYTYAFQCAARSDMDFGITPWWWGNYDTLLGHRAVGEVAVMVYRITVRFLRCEAVAELAVIVVIMLMRYWFVAWFWFFEWSYNVFVFCWSTTTSQWDLSQIRSSGWIPVILLHNIQYTWRWSWASWQNFVVGEYWEAAGTLLDKRDDADCITGFGLWFGRKVQTIYLIQCAFQGTMELSLAKFCLLCLYQYCHYYIWAD